jgi:hypothetical protein
MNNPTTNSLNLEMAKSKVRSEKLSTLTEVNLDNLRHMVEEKFAPLWDLGLFGLQVRICRDAIEITSYALRENSIDTKVDEVARDIQLGIEAHRRLMVEHRKGIIPAHRLTIELMPEH